MKKEAEKNNYDHAKFNKVSNALALAFISVSGNRIQAAVKARMDDWNGLKFDKTSRCGLVRIGGLYNQEFKTTNIVPVNVPESICRLIDDYVEVRKFYVGNRKGCEELFVRSVKVKKSCEMVIKPIDDKNYSYNIMDYFPGIKGKDLRSYWSTTALDLGDVDLPLVLQHSANTSKTYYDSNVLNRTKRDFGRLMEAGDIQTRSVLSINETAEIKRNKLFEKDKERVQESNALRKIEHQLKINKPKIILRTAVLKALLENRDSQFTKAFLLRTKNRQIIPEIKRLKQRSHYI